MADARRPSTINTTGTATVPSPQGGGDEFVYRLTVADCLKLQGFDERTVLHGSESAQWKMVGNTIPTVLTTIVTRAVDAELRRVTALRAKRRREDE